VMATLAQDGRPDIPFGDAAGLCAVIMAGGCLLVAGLDGRAVARRGGIIAAGVIIAVEAPFQMALVWAAVLWALLSAGALWLARSEGKAGTSYLCAAAAGLVAVASAALLIAPPSRLAVSWGGVSPHPLLLSEATVVLGALAAGLLVAGWLHARADWASGALAAGSAAVLYLISVAVVDIFAADAYGPPPAPWSRVEELAKQAHVAMSVTWTSVGVLVTATGLLLKRPQLRLAGLAVLALASAKVFIFDLSTLDVAYRVVTLIVLGILLIACALAWTRLKPRAGTVDPGPDVTTANGGLTPAPTRPASRGSTPVR
jgi:uncharacterized membrane protein